MKQPNYLVEQLKTIRNLTDISLLLLRDEQDALIPTILELLHQETQQIVDDHCVDVGKEADDSPDYCYQPDNTTLTQGRE